MLSIARRMVGVGVLVETGDPQNILAFLIGLVFFVMGFVFILKRAQIAAFFTQVQSTYGPLGRRVAQESRPWVSVMVGVGFGLGGLALVLMGLFAHLDPPGTPRSF